LCLLFPESAYLAGFAAGPPGGSRTEEGLQ